MIRSASTSLGLQPGVVDVLLTTTLTITARQKLQERLEHTKFRFRAIRQEREQLQTELEKEKDKQNTACA